MWARAQHMDPISAWAQKKENEPWNDGFSTSGGSFTGGGEPFLSAASLVMDVVRSHFRPELLNRIDEIILFKRLGRAEMDDIVGIQLQRVEKREQGYSRSNLLGRLWTVLELVPAAVAPPPPIVTRAQCASVSPSARSS